MSEAVLAKHDLGDATIETMSQTLCLCGMASPLLVGMLSHTGIRDDLIYLYMLLESGRTEPALIASVRDSIVEKKISFADSDDAVAVLFVDKLPSMLDGTFIEKKCSEYKLSKPYKYALLILLCVSGKLTKRLTDVANETIIRTGGHQLAQIATKKYTDADFENTEKVLMTKLKVVFASLFRALKLAGDKQIPVIGTAVLAYPEYKAVPIDIVPTTAADGITAIENFLIQNRETFHKIEQYYISKARQIDNITKFIMDVYALYFGKDDAEKAFTDCI